LGGRGVTAFPKVGLNERAIMKGKKRGGKE